MAETSNVIRLASSKEKVVRACSTCKYRYREMGSYRCGAVERYCLHARLTECLDGVLWEPKPPLASVLTRARRWLFGDPPRS